MICVIYIPPIVMQCVRHFAELIRIADKVAVAAVPEVDIHNAVRNPDILLFGSFAKPV